MRVFPVPLLVLAMLVPAGAPQGAAPQAESLESLMLMHVDGKVTIEPDGRIGDLSFDTKFDEVLRSALEAKMRAWRFKPVLIGAQARRAQTQFRVMLAAERDGGQYQVHVDGTRFGPVQTPAAIAAAIVPDGVAPPITAKQMTPPKYPMNQMMAGNIGSVHLVIRVSPDGRAADVAATQSLVFDIDGRETQAGARRNIRVFEDAAIAAARRWTFNVPPGGATRSAGEMTVSTDVEYQIRYDTGVAGQWVPVRRAPKRPIAWLSRDQAEDTGVGMTAAGQVAGVASPYQLAAPVTGDVVM